MPNIYESIEESQNCNNCEKIHKWQIEHIKHMRTEHDRYNTIVCSLGYGSLITILNLVKNDLNIWVTFTSAICLIISIGIFVFLEMKNITSSKAQTEKLTTVIYYNCKLSQIKQIYNSFYKDDLERIKFFNKWRPISLYSGFIAAGIITLGIIYPIIPKILKSFIAFILI